MNKQILFRGIVVLIFALSFSMVTIKAQTTAFTYQGKLTDGGNPANGNYDLQFKLFDTATVGTQQGSTVTVSNVTVTGGIFTVALDFGVCASCFNGSARFLEISVKPTSGGIFTPLEPRQPITSTPYAFRSLTTETATNATQLGGVPAAQFVQMDVNGNVSVSGNLSVAGALTLNTVNSNTEYQIGGQRVFKTDGNVANTFAGLFAGQSNTTGNANSFFGYDAGRFNTTAFFNSFFGFEAGRQTTTGDSNSFFGVRAGHDNTTGKANSFFGREAGYFNTTGNSNSFFGNQAGFRNTSGAKNAFFGNFSGSNNTIGNQNAIFGYFAGSGNTTGNNNSFFGYAAGELNSTGERNSFFGTSAGGSCFSASCPNQLTGSDNAFFGFETGFSNTTGSGNAFFGLNAGRTNVMGNNNSFFGLEAGLNNTTGSGNSFVGMNAGDSNTIGSNNIAIGANANFNANNLTYATAIGSNAVVGTSNTIVLGRSAGQDTVQIPGGLSVTGAVAGSGSALTNLNASNLTTGTIDNARLGVVPVANGGTGSATKNFVDLTTTQTIGGNKTFSNTLTGNTVNAIAQYSIGGSRVLSLGFNSIYLGPGIGATGTGSGNSFFGFNSGSINGSGFNNSFFGLNTGNSNSTGNLNSFFGVSAGEANTTGIENSFFGVSAGEANVDGNQNAFFGTLAGLNNVSGDNNSFFGAYSALNNTTGANNVFIGRSAGDFNTTGSNNTAIGHNADVGFNNLTYATAIGADAVASLSNSIYLGRANGADAVRIPGAVLIDGSLVVHTLGSAGSTQICLNSPDRLAPCSSSLRYKTNVESFLGGLDVVRRLRPITFNWKDGGKDIGFAAEEINEIEPLLATHNKQGAIEGVKYGQLTTVLVNAVKEQQAQIEAQQKQLQNQQLVIASLIKSLCQVNPQADICLQGVNQ